MASVSSEKKIKKIPLVVKRRGHTQPFDERKIYGSIYSACSNCSIKEQECEKIAEQVVEEVKNTVAGKKEVNSTELFGLIIAILAKYHEDAAFMYQVHRDIS